MPILRRLSGLDWPRLIAEIVLIFLGITAALWFDNRNQERADRLVEEQILMQLQVALQADTADLNFNLRSSVRTVSAIDSVLVYLDAGRSYDSTLATHFGRSTIHTNFLGDRSAYEFLKTVGLDIISDAPLRVQITGYYETAVQYLTRVEEVYVNENFNRSVRPRMIEDFSYHFLYGPAVPNDYRALVGDPSYRSLLTTTRAVLRFKDGRTEDVLERAEALLRAIKEHLATR